MYGQYLLQKLNSICKQIFGDHILANFTVIQTNKLNLSMQNSLESYYPCLLKETNKTKKYFVMAREENRIKSLEEATVE